VARVVITVQALRAFVYGFGAVILGTSLAAQGLSDAAVGAVFTAMLAGMALASFGVARWGGRVRPQRLYRLLLGVMGIAGAVFALTTWLPALVLAAMTGTLSTDANESGPITTLEQGMLAGAPPAARARVFGRYNATAYLAGAAGALLAGGPAAIRRIVHALPSDQHWLLLFPVVAVACVAVAARLRTSPDSDADQPVGAPRARGALSDASRETVRRLATLFAVDAFAGGLVVQSFIVFWFHRRFGASTEVMGLVLFAAGLLSAASSIAAGWLGPRIGLLETMVYTHLPSNVLLAAVALMPNLGAAIAVLLARFALSQMDVPARQALIATVVAPAERTAAAGYTNTARYVGRPIGPVVAGVVMQRVAVAAPFLIAGGVKVVYDLVIFASLRGTAEVRRPR
jgi:hypothetical protein